MTRALSLVLQDIREERARQDAKWGRGFEGRTDSFWLTIAAEEFGEIANAILEEKTDQEVEDEITQLAAVMVSWLEFRTMRRDQRRELERGAPGRKP